MKKFTRVEPTIVQDVGLSYRRQVVIKKFETDDGMQHEFTTMYREGDEATGVIALTPDNQVITVLQFRSGPEQWAYEIPGGGVEEGESHRDAAVRELAEETGYNVGKIKYLGESYGPAYINTQWHYYLATECTPIDDGPSLDAEERDQGAEVHFMSIDNFIENAKHGVMTDPRAVLMAYDELKELEGKI